VTEPATASPPETATRHADRRPSLGPRSAAALAAIIASTVYLLTMNRTIGFLDSGEVAAAAATLGIMHPTGYPTLTLLAYLVSVVVPVREILALNIFAALLAGAGAGALTLLFDRIARVAMTPRPKPARRLDPGARTRSAKKQSSKRVAVVASPVVTPRSPAVSVEARALVAALAALFVAFTAIWWAQATGFEVYALQALLLPLVCLLFLRFVDRERERRDAGLPVRFIWDASLFALTLGVAFTNHLMTIFLAPAFLVYYFWSLGVGARALRRLLLLIPPFALGLLPYLYLPLRSALHPRFNWGRPDSWQRFVDHVSGRFAWEWMFSSDEIYRAQTGYFFGRLPGEVAYVGLAIAIAGLVILAVRNPRVALWSALIFAGCVAYAGGYRIYDIELYYATAILALGLWVSAALGWLLTKSAPAAIGVAALLAVANIALHYELSDQSGNRLGEDFVHNVLVTAPRNAMIFSSNAAVFVTGSYYLQEVERLRPDVTVINHDYLSNDWYVEELEDWKPELMRSVGPLVRKYRDLLTRGNAGDVGAGLASTDAYDEMLRGLVDWQLDRGGDAIVVGTIDRGFGSHFQIVPWQLGYRLVRDSAYVAQPFPQYRFSHWTHIDPFAANIYELYGRQLAYRASYEAEHGHAELADRYRRYALGFDPQYDVKHAGELPLDAMSQVQATAEFYARLRQTVTAEAPAR
jgi:hypothetical protein